MANKEKTGLDYFPCEVTIFTDRKIRRLLRSQNGQALPIYLYLLCSIYTNGYYMRWDEDLAFDISEALPGFKEGFISEVINCCLGVGLFSKSMYDEYGILTSKGIQERYIKICKLLKRKSTVDKFSLINSEEIGINSEELPINSEELLQKKRKEKKVKEIKVNENNKEENLDKVSKLFIDCFSRTPNSADRVNTDRLIGEYGFENVKEAFFKARLQLGDKISLAYIRGILINKPKAEQKGDEYEYD